MLHRTRRALIGFILPLLASEPPVTPKNRTAVDANIFNRMFATWADAFNKTKSGGIDAAECAAWEPLPKQFRQIEHARMEWLRGSK